jgi:hypothetical protein
LAVDLIVQHLCQELGKAHSKSVDSSNIERELQTTMERNGAVAKARGLQDLAGRVQRGERLSDREFIEFGQRAGEIIKGSKP